MLVACADELQLMALRIIMRIPDPITGPKDVRSLLIIRGITGCVLIPYATLKFPDILFLAKVFRTIWRVFVTSALICRRCDSPDFFDASHDSSSGVHPPEGELFHQSSCRGR